MSEQETKQNENFCLLKQAFIVLLATIEKPDIPQLSRIIEQKKTLLENYYILEENGSNIFTRLDNVNNQFNSTVSKIFDELYQGEYEKFRYLRWCNLCGLFFVTFSNDTINKDEFVDDIYKLNICHHCNEILELKTCDLCLKGRIKVKKFRKNFKQLETNPDNCSCDEKLFEKCSCYKPYDIYLCLTCEKKIKNNPDDTYNIYHNHCEKPRMKVYYEEIFESSSNEIKIYRGPFSNVSPTILQFKKLLLKLEDENTDEKQKTKVFKKFLKENFYLIPKKKDEDLEILKLVEKSIKTTENEIIVYNEEINFDLRINLLCNDLKEIFIVSLIPQIRTLLSFFRKWVKRILKDSRGSQRLP